MATRDIREQRIKRAIKKIAEGPRSVLLSDIQWVMTRLRDDLGYRVTMTGQNQHYTFTVGDLLPFQVCDHHKGQKELKVVYVRAFLDRMTDLNLL